MLAGLSADLKSSLNFSFSACHSRVPWSTEVFPGSLTHDHLLSCRLIHPSSGRSYHEEFNPPKEPMKDDVCKLRKGWLGWGCFYLTRKYHCLVNEMTGDRSGHCLPGGFMLVLCHSSPFLAPWPSKQLASQESVSRSCH